MSLDRAIQALKSLESAVDKLEAASAPSTQPEAAPGAEDALRQTIRTLQAENGRLRAVNKAAADRMEAVIARLETMNGG